MRNRLTIVSEILFVLVLMTFIVIMYVTGITEKKTLSWVITILILSQLSLALWAQFIKKDKAAESAA